VRRAERWADRLSLLCFAALALVMLVTLPDYGLTYDEQPHLALGERVLRFYGNFVSSPGLLRSAYGAGFDLSSALLRLVSPWDEYRTNHLLCVFVAQLGLLGSWKLARLLAGPLGALAALLFLVLTPVYYGHQFNNPKDIPFAVGYIWGLYMIAQWLCWQPEPRQSLLGHARRALGLGLILGLAMSVRIAGVVLIGYLVTFLLLRALDTLRLQRGAERAQALRSLGSVGMLAALGAFASWGVMLMFWPWAWARPVEQSARALEIISNFTAYDSPTLLRGQHISSNRVPWDYLPTYFAAQLPELLSACLAASAVGLCVHTWLCLRRRRPLAWSWWLVLVATALPPAYAIGRHSTLYNGLRHFLFLIPPISVLAGAGLARLGLCLARSRPRWALLPALGFALFALDQLLTLWRLHPYQHVYFNRSSGGVAAAVDRYETEYYGAVYRELNARLLERVWTERRDSYLNTTYQVAGCGSKLFFTRNLPLNFQYQAMRDAGSSDFYASYVRDDCLHRFRDRALITSVERDGATLAVARDLKVRAGRKASGAGVR
jgi:hypothetical protein